MLLQVLLRLPGHSHQGLLRARGEVGAAHLQGDLSCTARSVSRWASARDSAARQRPVVWLKSQRSWFTVALPLKKSKVFQLVEGPLVVGTEPGREVLLAVVRS